MSKAVNLKLYRVDDSYLDYLRQVDSRVPINKDSGKARPFVGILHFVNGREYVAPLSSQLTKARTDFKILLHNEHKAMEEHKATVRFAYMFPVNKKVIEEIDFTVERVADANYTALLLKEINYINANEERVHKIINDTYIFRVTKAHGYDKFCCDFLKLEQALDSYK